MRLSIISYNAASVYCKNNRQTAKTHIMNHLVIGTLQKGGVDRNDRKHPLLGKAARHRHGVLLGDADVEASGREAVEEGAQTRALDHCRRDRADARLLSRQLAERAAEGLGEGRRMRLGHRAGLRVKAADAVEDVGVGLGRDIALALLRNDVQQHRAGALLRQAQHVFQLPDVVAIDRAVIDEAHLLEKGRAEHELLPALLDGVGKAIDRLAAGHLGRDRAEGLFQPEIARPDADLRQMLGDTADIRSNGHAVVVQNDDQRLIALPGVVQALIGHAAGHRAVAQQGNHAVILLLQRPCARHAQRRRDG